MLQDVCYQQKPPCARFNQLHYEKVYCTVFCVKVFLCAGPRPYDQRTWGWFINFAAGVGPSLVLRMPQLAAMLTDYCMTRLYL